jgi:hypothetical protein
MFSINSYVLLSPGRTGSRYIVEIIKSSYFQNSISLKCNSPELDIKCFEPYNIYHSHTKEIIKLKNENTKIILSTRNLINSALSWGIVHYVKKYHYRQKNLLKIQIIPFYLDPLEFMFHYNNAKNFYQYFTKESLEKIVVINYDNILNSNDTINKDLILDKLDLKMKRFFPWFYPVKTPGKYSQWIKNWEEIKSISNGLEADPKSFFQN